MNSSNNLLVTLSRLVSGQENFLSDAFVHLLNLLAQQMPEAFAMVIKEITNGAITPTVETAPSFIVVSQIVTSEGRPDIEISGPNAYALIEVKDESPVDEAQIEKYTRLIEQNDADAKCLVLLTRYQAPSLGNSCLLKKIRWTQVTEWLLECDERFALDPVSQHTLRQLLGFLEAKGMAVNKAGWEMVAGIQQFTNFKVLLHQAIESAGAHRVLSITAADYNGWRIPELDSDTTLFDIFIDFEEPEALLFLCNPQEVQDKFRDEWEVANNHNYRQRKLDLSSEEVHFFSRSLDSQRKRLEEFVTSCLAQTTYRPTTSG